MRKISKQRKSYGGDIERQRETGRQRERETEKLTETKRKGER